MEEVQDPLFCSAFDIGSWDRTSRVDFYVIGTRTVIDNYRLHGNKDFIQKERERRPPARPKMVKHSPKLSPVQ